MQDHLENTLSSSFHLILHNKQFSKFLPSLNTHNFKWWHDILEVDALKSLVLSIQDVSGLFCFCFSSNIFSTVLFSRKLIKKTWFVAFVDFRGINSPTMFYFKLMILYHLWSWTWTWEERCLIGSSP